MSDIALIRNETNPALLQEMTTADTQPLGRPLAALSVATTSTATASFEAPAGTRAVSIAAVGAALRYHISAAGASATATASATFPATNNTSHYVASGERVDVKLAPLQGISFIRAGATDGTVEATFLA
jgi:hypothetical protein